MIRLEIRVKFCAISWPYWEWITTRAGSRVEGGGGCDIGRTVAKKIGGELDRSDSDRGGGGGGVTLEGLVDEE